ncbi:3'-5' DNA helicase [Sporothrix bragantina]|uniref:ATP-dependent DNA helicase MPH1 n=1 Tax=Sporothrix bragantina TaxID=671064 RepID=A0ABP0CW09_9PEZI
MDDDEDDFFGGDVADEDLMLAYETTASTRLSSSSRATIAVTTPSTISTARTTPRTSTGSWGAESSMGKPSLPAIRPNAASNNMTAPPRPQVIPSSTASRNGPQSQRNARNSTSQQAIDLTAELEDLPSDAFDSSFASYSGAASHSQRSIIAGVRNPLRILSQQSFRQTTLYGDTLEAESTQVTHNPNHAFVSDRPPEKPTHHKIDKEAMKTWVYPTNLGPIRDYQFSIVRSSLFNNTLVALPTGLGKTFIAATVILNFYRWTTDAKMIFVAPTKPLVSQQVDACLTIAGIPRSETTLLTGETPPQLREAEWASKRLFFMTPQTLQNDLSKGYAEPKSIALLVIDEAHRSTGDYAYVKVIGFMRRFTNSFRVLALTATPGSSVEAVQEVIDNLGMSHVEIRTEDSIDIRQYVHNRDIERLTMEPSTEMRCVQDLFSKALKPFCDKLTQQNIWFGRDPMSLNTFTLLKAQREWMAGPARHLNQGTKFMVMAVFALLKTLAHSIKLLNFHGIKACYDNLAGLRADAEKDEKGSKYRKQFFRDPDFQEMMMTIERWMREDGFESHPKLTFLKEQLHDHFKDQPPGSNTRAIVFNEFRDSAEDIVRTLNRGIPNVKASIFVGQADSKRSAGMKQKAQIEAIKNFKSGEFNVLVATSIGEEGLDIGQVDLIICYDASSSPIRMLQRMGRTGRKRAGRVLLLLMKGKEEDKFAEAQDKYSNMQKLVSEGSRFNFRFDLSERIVPRDIKPEVDKRQVEIPIENTQNTSLPEPKKVRGKLPKASKKKFHMPDDVETGFVTASTVGEEGQTKLGFLKTKVKSASPRSTVPEPAETDSLFDIPDLETAVRSARKNGGYNTSFSSAFGLQPDSAPVIDTAHPDFLQKPRPSKYLRHGTFTRRNVRLMGRLAEGAYDRPRSQGQAYLQQRVPAFAPHSDESETEEAEEVPELPSSKTRTVSQSRQKPAADALPWSSEPLSKRRRVVGSASTLTERARLTPVGYVTSQAAIKKEYSEDEHEDGGSSKWAKKKTGGFKTTMKGMTRQRSSQFQSYSFGGASVKRESSPEEDDTPSTSRRVFQSKRAREKRVPATRAPLPQYGRLPPIKPTAQRLLDDFSDGNDDLEEEPDRGNKSGLSSSAARKKTFDILDDDLDDGLNGDLSLDVDLEMADAIEDEVEQDLEEDMQKEMETMMEGLDNEHFSEEVTEKGPKLPEMPKVVVSTRPAPMARSAATTAPKPREISPFPEPPREPEFPDISDIPGMSDMSDLIDIPELPNFPKPREPAPREPTPREPIPREATLQESTLFESPPRQPVLYQPIRREPPPRVSPPRETSLTPSPKPESDTDQYIVRFSQPAGNGASLRGVRRGRGRGRGARGAGTRGAARGRGARNGARGFSAIAEEAEEGEAEDMDEYDSWGGGRSRGRGRGGRGRGGRGAAVSYGRLEERGDDCMRTSDNYETDGSDCGSDLVDFIVGDDEEVDEEAPTSSFAEHSLDDLDDSASDDDDDVKSRSRKDSRKSDQKATGRRLMPKSKRKSTVVFTSSPVASSPPPVAAALKNKSTAAQNNSRSTAGKTSKTKSNGSFDMPIRLSQTRDDSDDDDEEPSIFSERRGRANQQAPSAAAGKAKKKATATATKKRAPAKVTGPPPKSAEFILSGEDNSSDACANGKSNDDDDEDAVSRRPAGAQRGRRLVLDSDSE